MISRITTLTFALGLSLFLFSCTEKEDENFLNKEDADALIEEIIRNIEEPEIPEDTIDIVKFSGHRPDAEGSTDFYPFIRNAIDSLEKRGGGWLLFPNSADPGSWVRYRETFRIEGPVNLKSNIGLLIDRSVRLFFPFDPEDYLIDGKPVLTRYEGTTIYSFSPLIRAFNQHDIVIRSRGRSGEMPLIDGDGEKWQQWMWDGEAGRRNAGIKPAYQKLKDVNNADIPIAERVYGDPSSDFFRPETMEFFLCKRILVEGIKLTNSPFWCIKPVFSESAVFRDLAFDAMNVNNDGVDPESSKNILIEHIMFSNHDDNVAIKAGRDKEGRDGAIVKGTELEEIESDYISNGRITGPTENVVIRNNMFHGHHAICIGSEMSGGVRNVYAVDNQSVLEVNMGVFIKSSRFRGGTVENVYVRNLDLNRTKSEVISIVPNYDKADDKNFPPLFRNIQIEDLRCNSSDGGILIHGWYDKPVQDVLLKDLRLKNVKGEEILIRQSEDVILENVIINGKDYNEKVTNLEKGEKPPKRN